MAALNDTQRVSVVLDGLVVTTTVGLLRAGAISTCVDQLLRDFEAERERRVAAGEPPCFGYGTTYKDYEGKSRNLQIDLQRTHELDRYVVGRDASGDTIFIPAFATYVEAITASGCGTFSYEDVAKLFSEGVTAREAARRLNRDLAERRRAPPPFDPLDRDHSMNGDYESAGAVS